jgi:hypothetical protein
MDFGPGSGDRRDVAVGPSRELAARVFGGRFDSALVTTYDAFDTDVDLATVASIGVAAGPGLDALLDRLETEATHLWPERVLLGLPADRAGRKILDTALARHPSVAVAEVVESDRGLVLSLDRAANVPSEARERALATIRTPVPEVEATPDPATDRARGAGRATRRQLLVRAGLLASALAVVLVVVLVVVGRSPAGTDGVLVTLMVVGLLPEVVIAMGVAYAVRLARQTRAEHQEQRRLLLDRTDRLIGLARMAASRDKETLGELELLRHEVDALGRLQSRARAEARERP